MKRSFKLIVISPEDIKKNEAKQVIELFGAGLTIYHLRKPGASKKEIISFLDQIPKKYHKRIVINSHYELSGAYKLKGIHLPEKIRKKRNIKKRKTGEIISTSFHKIADVLKNRKKFEYAFLSPVYDSITKKNYKSNFTSEELQSFLVKRKNIIALGGITEKNLEEVMQLGFSGAAVLGYIWEGKAPLVKFKKLLSKI